MILRLDHTAHAAWDPQPLVRLYGEMLGGHLKQGSVTGKGFAYIQFTFPHSSRIEVIYPTSKEPSFLTAFLERHGERLHHLTYIVDDLRAEIARFREAGYRVVDEDLSDTHWQEAFLHPASTHGTLIQLACSDLDHTGQDREWSAHDVERVLAAAVGRPG